MIRFAVKSTFVLTLLWTQSTLASLQILDPEIYQSEINFVQAQSPHLNHPSLRTTTQDEFKNQTNALDSRDKDFISSMLRNTYEDESWVFNAQLRSFFYAHNSRPLPFLELDANTDPMFSRNNVYVPGNFGGFAPQFYAEAFRFFSFDIKPFFLIHEANGVGHATLQEMYGSIHINRLSIDIGKARLRWGYGAYQPMVFSDDSAPLPMIRLRSSEAIDVGFLGKVKFEMMYGWLDQFRTYPNGSILASTFSIQPTDRLHFHLAQTVLFGGTGSPTSNPLVFFNETFVDDPRNPANRNFTLGARYRIPGIELEPYADIYVEDCCGKTGISPRNMLNLFGLYMPPKDAGKKFDMAFEWVRTNHITYRHQAFIYTQSRQILGHPLGPDGNGFYLVPRFFHSKKLQLDGVISYEVRGREGRALSNLGFIDIRTLEPSFQSKETRYRMQQTTHYWLMPKWKWMLQAGLERVNDLNYQLGNNKWQYMLGLESAYNF
ncbi:MAG: capsule assembly Wzi family protein [Bdellovibrionota bacterium]